MRYKIKILVTLPTYCESHNITRMLDHLMLIPRLDVVVIDDDSSDRTWELVQNYEEFNKRVFLLRRTEEKGRGLAGKTGFLYALKQDGKYDCVVEMDADFSHQPEEIMKLVSELGDSDIVLGSRFIKGGKDLHRELRRRLLSKFSTIYVRIITGMPFYDPNSGFKAYKMEALKKIGVEKIKSKNYSFTQEILYRAFRAGLKIKEVPISFYNRRWGESNVNKRIVLETFFFIIKMRLQSFSKDW